MTVAIIGHGKMGAGLARAIVNSGKSVVLAGRDLDKAGAVAAELGSKASAASVADALAASDVVVLAVPYASIDEVLSADLNFAGKTVIDISNPITPDFRGLVVGHTTSAAEVIQKKLPGAVVVKAFNTIFAGLLNPEGRNGKTLQTFIAGDGDAEKTAVAELAKLIGFEPVESGPLSNSRFLEPIGEMNIHFAAFLGKGPVVAPAWVEI